MNLPISYNKIIENLFKISGSKKSQDFQTRASKELVDLVSKIKKYSERSFQGAKTLNSKKARKNVYSKNYIHISCLQWYQITPIAFLKNRRKVAHVYTASNWVVSNLSLTLALIRFVPEWNKRFETSLSVRRF